MSDLSSQLLLISQIFLYLGMLLVTPGWLSVLVLNIIGLVAIPLVLSVIGSLLSLILDWRFVVLLGRLVALVLVLARPDLLVGRVGLARLVLPAPVVLVLLDLRVRLELLVPLG